LFNDKDSGYDVLVASDAIGMGLNLNIGRIIFHSTLKRNINMSVSYIEPTYVKQIAGRAGRKSSNYPVGKVTTWQEADLAYVKAVMKWDIPPITAAGIFPTVEQVESFVDQLVLQEGDNLTIDNEIDYIGNKNKDNISSSKNSAKTSAITANNSRDKSIKSTVASSSVIAKKKEEDKYSNIQLSAVIERFIGLSKIDRRYFMCNHDNFSTITNWIHTIPMSIADK
jgi:superfamily II DNA/RNA helicase